MTRRLTWIAIVFAGAFGAAQLVPLDRTNPSTDASRAIQSQAGAASGLGVLLERSCRDCHSNATVWPSYARVAPVSWLMAYAVKKGRRAVNFSEWASYSPEQQRILLALSCRDASEGKMPGLYGRLRPETRLSVQDIETICAAGRAAAGSGGGPHAQSGGRHEPF
jgi:heme-binding protein